MADEKNEEQESGGLKSLVDELPLDQLKDDLQGVFAALGDKAKDTVMQRLSDATDSLNDMAQNGGVLTKAAGKGAKAAAEGESPVKGALKGGLGGVKDKVKSALPGGGGGGGGGGSKPTKSTNIIEEIDIGAPVDVVYNQWTQFQDFSGFMKKVKSVEQEEDEKLTFQAQVFWSHRTWEATILEQVPNERIIWRSKGEKGHVDGAVTFHELAPNMTRVLVVLEYYPQGFMERTGNIWRAQGRRARLELKHFRRHVMTRTLLDQDELEGWRGEIRDSEVVRDHEEVVEEEREQDEYEGEEEETPEDEYDEEEPEDEGAEEEEEAPEDEYDEEEPEDEDEVEDEEPEEKPRRRSSAKKKTSSRKRR
ncbi:MAG TPA: SRPBCC family protein [Nocardioidaceae bacterium]|nr:SRPBCC family protein [Nocardioidaceae bacterium]